MLPFKKILFPVDYSDPCRAMAPCVADLQKHFSAELALVHAFGAEALAYSALPITDPHLIEEAQARQEANLLGFAEKYFADTGVETYVGTGEPASVIHDMITRQGADLVVLPTHGSGPLRRLLLGSVTTKVLHDLATPVLTGHPVRLPWKSVLCALDSSEEAESILRAADAVARSFGAQLSITSVLEIPPPDIEMAYGNFREDFMNAAQTRLRELKSRTGIQAPHTVLDGPVADALAEEAKRTGAQLIVTGRGVSQTTISRLWSHLYPIIRHAPCVVLSI